MVLILVAKVKLCIGRLHSHGNVSDIGSHIKNKHKRQGRRKQWEYDDLLIRLSQILAKVQYLKARATS